MVGVLKILFLILLFLFPLGEIARVSFENSIAVTLNDIAVAATVTVWLINTGIKRKYKPFINAPLAKPIGLFILVCLLSLLVNVGNYKPHELFVASLYLVRWTMYAGLYFLVREFDQAFKRKIPFYLIAVGAVVILGGYVQFFFYPNLQNLYYLGWDEHLYRMFSSFLDPNFAGTFFVLYSLLISFFVLLFLKRKAWKKVWLHGLLGIATLGAIVLTYSRSALLMLIVSYSLFFFLIGKKKFILLMIFLLLTVFTILSRNFHMEGQNLLRTASSVARVESAMQALVIIKDHPILGVGFNTYRYALFHYGFVDPEISATSHSGAGTDNSFLFVLATTGIFGLLSYLFIWWRVIRKAHEQYKRVQRNTWNSLLSIIVICSSLGLFTNALFVNSLFYTFLTEWMWILIGLGF